MNQPNIILLTIDSLRADLVGCYGHTPSLTPHLDRLAADGIVFENAITGGSWTQAAFPVLFTSTYASMYGGCLGPLSARRPSPIEALAKAGYQTAGFSTSPLLSRKYGYERGFDHFDELVPNEADPQLRRMKGGQFLLRQPWTHRVAQALGRNLRPARVYSSAAELTQKVVEWLAEVEGPYFLWAHYMDVHWPYHLEEELSEAQACAQAWQDLAHLYDVNWHGAGISAQQRAHYMALYERAVSYTDRAIGQLVDALKLLGHDENTILVVVSDHGEEFLERRHWGHFEINLHDEILRVPLIIRLPGQTAGSVIKSQVRTLDLMPTLLECCACPAPAGMKGKSLAPLWTDKGQHDESPLSLSEMWRDERHIIALRTEQYKYIWDSKHPDQPRLYDLVSDPQEQRNIVVKEPALAARLQEHVDEHLQYVVETAGATPTAEPQLDRELLKRLRDLGYVR